MIFSLGGSLVSYSADGDRNPTVVINLMNKSRVLLGTNSDTTTLKRRHNPDGAITRGDPAQLPIGASRRKSRFKVQLDAFARRFDRGIPPLDACRRLTPWS